MSDKPFEDRLRQRAANMRALASMPGASGPLRVWVELPVDEADRLADLVAAVRKLYPTNRCMRRRVPANHNPAVMFNVPCGECPECRMCAALAALDEASRG